MNWIFISWFVIMNIESTIEKLESCDIMLKQSHDFIGWAISSAFHKDSLLSWYAVKYTEQPSSHNGIFGYDANMKPVIFEAVGSGFIPTPIEDYIKAVYDGECELKFARPMNGWSDEQKEMGREWCLKHLYTGYDYRAFISFIWRILLRLPPFWNSQDKAKFWCTEADAELYMYLDERWGKIFPEMPCPYTIEKLIIKGELKVVDEWYRR